MTIYIPTYGRVEQQTTYSIMSDRWRARTFLVAVPDEVEPLRKLGYNVLERPTNGISETRQWIVEQHPADIFGPRIVMMDDDLKFYRRRPEYPSRFRQLKPNDPEFDEFMAELFDVMGSAPLAGVTNRSGANRHMEQTRYNVRIHDLLAINTDHFRDNGYRLDRLEFMEDFDLVLQVLTGGWDIPVMNTWCEGDSRGRDSGGGCSDERTMEKQRTAALRLQELWPFFVKAVEKQMRGQGQWATRTDVTVQWARAAKFGKDSDVL